MQRYFSKSMKNKKIILYDTDIHHIKKVMRNKVNDKIEVVSNGKTYLCNIDDLSDFSISIINEVEKNNELNVEIILALALLKEQKQDLVLQKVTELGVNTIIPLNLKRNVVQINKDKEDKKLMRWNNICKEASEQSKRNIIPNILNISNLTDLKNIDADYKFVLSTKEDKKLLNLTLQKINNCDRIIIVVGSEGGITLEEEEYLNSIGFESISLGSRIMRAETAAIYVTSVINYLFMR